MSNGLHIGAQLFAMVDGQVVVDLSVGKARAGNAGDVAMQSDTLMLWLSAGKPMTAAGVLILWEQGAGGTG
ncbi:MAG TPA: serine hydrolase [Phycisphaerae bacterium]|jgi:CubicO group peptidase (beta-lactamase class C family)